MAYLEFQFCHTSRANSREFGMSRHGVNRLRKMWHSCQMEGSGVKVDQNCLILLPAVLPVADVGVEERSHKNDQWDSQKSNDIGEDGCRG